MLPGPGTPGWRRGRTFATGPHFPISPRRKRAQASSISHCWVFPVRSAHHDAAPAALRARDRLLKFISGCARSIAPAGTLIGRSIGGGFPPLKKR